MPTGPAPKAANKRARRNADPIPTTTLRFEQADAPDLPDGYDWPLQTRKWWETWKQSPQADHFGSTDWLFLLETALVHAELWAGNIGAAAELRLRVAKFGATPEDRARLRMQFAQADDLDSKRPVVKPAEEYGDLRVVGALAGA